MSEVYRPDPWLVHDGKGVVLDDGPIAHFVSAAYEQDFAYYTRCGEQIQSADRNDCKVASCCDTPICEACIIEEEVCDYEKLDGQTVTQ